MRLLPAWLTSQESRFWSTIARVAALIGLIFPIVSIVSFFLTGSAAKPALILAIYVCVLATTLIVLLIIQENRFIREARYGPAVLPMRKAFEKLANATWHVVQGESSQEAFRAHMKESLRYLAEAFTLVTGVTSRTSIKLIAAPTPGLHQNDIPVQTLCRNEDGPERRWPAPDRIGDNTDFKQIFMEDAAYFFCNDLPAQLSKGYRNSHWDEHTIETGAFEYRATIVWPIGRSSDTSESGESREIIGFLCVDSLATDKFHRTYDVGLGAAYSQALYLALYRYRELSSQQTGTPQ